MDWNFICGTPSLIIWSPQEKNVGQCFSKLAFSLPTSLFLTIVSWYYIGKEYNWVIRNRYQLVVLSIRAFICLGLGIVPFVKFLIKCYKLDSLFLADVVVAFIETSCWFSHAIYVLVLKNRISRSIRGPLLSLAAWLLTILPSIIQLKSVISNYNEQSIYTTQFWLEITTAILQLLYLLTLIPHGIARTSDFDANFQSLAAETAEQAPHSITFLPLDADPYYLGVARDQTTFLSRVFLSWIQPLMKKGSRKLLNSPDDLFDLPNRNSTHYITPQIAAAIRIKGTLLGALHHCFGTRYYLLGILKFIGDSLGFVGPLLLNVLVQFIDDKTEPMLFGYLCAAALCLSSFIGALSNVHFNFGVAEIGLQMRVALVSLIYSKTLTVSSASLSQLSTGEIVNMMSTDTDRIVNFCPSFHAFWSLPVQIGVSLYFLYTQVGLAFLAGLGFAILLIPLNRVIASRIGKLSQKMMEAKDERVKLMNELLSGIKTVKLYAWENVFREKIEEIRNKELKALKGRKYLDALCVYFWATTPVLVAILTFTTFVLMGGTLTAAKTFTCMALFNMLISPLNAFPWVLNGLVEAWVSLKRVQKLIQLPNMDCDAYYAKKADDDVALTMKDADFSWQEDGFHLSNLNVTIKKGQFVGVIGKVGSGKSTFLEAIVGELVKRKGTISVTNANKGFAVASQDAWIQRGTLRENIIFGKPYDSNKYKTVLEVCALNADLQALVDADQTEVGENGATLSGGQKARVALARAAYQDKDIYLMDDVLSAVDPVVAKHIIDHLFLRYLKDKTRILCTHHAQFLTEADWIIVLQDGSITLQGPPAEVIPKYVKLESPTSTRGALTTADSEERESKLPQEEERCTGTVKFSVYSSYWKAVGLHLSPIILASLFFMQFTRNTSDWWLAHWVSESQNSTNSSVSHLQERRSIIDLFNWSAYFSSSVLDDDAVYYLSVYGGIAVSNTIFTFLRAFLFAYGGLKAAKIMHRQLLQIILKAKATFFDATPIGRILNRFSADLYAIDDSLPFILNIFLAQLYALVGTITVTCIGIPWILLLLLPLGLIYFNLQHYYRHTSRELKRLSTVSLSPIYSHFTETLSGLITIKAARSTLRFKDENEDMVENNIKTQFASQAASQWLNLRLQLIGVALITGVGVFAVIQHHLHTVDPGLVGLAISYALSITSILSGVVTSFVETEKEMVSVERVYYYIQKVQSEISIGRISPPASWPERGIVVFNNVSLRYREHLPYALRYVSFETKPAEKIGIVGRTGSGKTSLFQALFRMADVFTGDIIIDHIEIKSITLKDLRSRIAIIPQDPFLFSGSIRENLDPTFQFSDEQLWIALRQCHLADSVSKWGGLLTDVLEKGKLFSTGQKQLLCLARALLLNAKVICIDEATANVDLETDQLIQQTIRAAFQFSTVLTIAHRTDTIMDSDRILVMSGGQVVECDSPENLLRNGSSHFYQLVHYLK